MNTISFELGQSFKSALVSTQSARESLAKIFGAIRQEVIGNHTDKKAVRALRASLYDLCSGGVTDPCNPTKTVAFGTCKNYISQLMRDAGLVERETSEVTEDSANTKLAKKIQAFIDSLPETKEMDSKAKYNLTASVGRLYQKLAKSAK